jgi:DNA ligase (NAD+)
LKFGTIQNQIGTKDTRAIEWGIARKWNDDIVETELIGVDWQVGRTGVLTPVARLNTVECCGVKVSNATLNNADFIKSFDLHIGNTITITRSGDVIPQVIGVTHDIFMEVNGAYPNVEIPTTCPVCGMPLIADGKLLKCTNDECPAIVEGKILRFCSKDCMDIKSVGEAMIHDLVYKCNVSKFTDLYTLRNNYTTAEHLAEILGAGYGEKSCAKLLDAIDNSRNKPFENLLASLSIPGVGKVIARTLVKEFGSLEKLLGVSVSELTTVDGIGGIMASDIYNYFHSTDGIQTCKFFIENGFNTSAKIEEMHGCLSGMIICFTGKSFRFAGDKIEEYLENNGAKCARSVTGKTTYLITGETPGTSKVAKSQSLGVQILTEEEFYDKYNL